MPFVLMANWQTRGKEQLMQEGNKITGQMKESGTSQVCVCVCVSEKDNCRENGSLINC